jgi:fumarate hydratase class II
MLAKVMPTTFHVTAATKWTNKLSPNLRHKSAMIDGTRISYTNNKKSKANFSGKRWPLGSYSSPAD